MTHSDKSNSFEVLACHVKKVWMVYLHLSTFFFLFRRFSSLFDIFLLFSTFFFLSSAFFPLFFGVFRRFSTFFSFFWCFSSFLDNRSFWESYLSCITNSTKIARFKKWNFLLPINVFIFVFIVGGRNTRDPCNLIGCVAVGFLRYLSIVAKSKKFNSINQKMTSF